MLTEGPAAMPVPVGPDFWQREVQTLPAGRLVTKSTTAGNWGHWEMHPAGDEVVYQVSGISELVLEADDGEERVRLAAGRFVIVPQGVWHTADTVEPGEMLFITPGAGTQHRPR